MKKSLLCVFVAIVLITGCRSRKNAKITQSTSETVKEAITEEEVADNAPNGKKEIKEEKEASPQDAENIELKNNESDPLDEFSLSEKNAIKSAQQYLDFSGFSRQGLIDQLSSEYGNGYPVNDAITAVEYLENNSLVDWNEEAVREAQNYLNYSAFSRLGLIDQLSSDSGSKFTVEQAEYAINYLEDNNLVDWFEQAAKEAESYMNYSSFSKQELINQLSSEYGSKFTLEEAEYGAKSVGY